MPGGAENSRAGIGRRLRVYELNHPLGIAVESFHPLISMSVCLIMSIFFFISSTRF